MKDIDFMTAEVKKPGSPTLQDVANAAGVTLATASRSLAEAYGVHPETRKRVKEAALKLQYKPNRFARALATGRSNVIGLVISDVRNPYFAEVARGAEDAAFAADRELMLCNSDLDAAKQMRYINSLLERRVEGIVMNSVMNITREEQSYLSESGVPVVLLYRPNEQTRFSTVSTDSTLGGELAANCLLENGHRHLVFLSGPREHANLASRASAFVERVRKFGGGATVSVVYGTHTLSGGYEMAKILFRKPGGVTGIATANDAVAFGVLKAALEMGVDIPRDFSLIGYDDVELASIVHPPLTTIRQSKYEIGAAAVEILLRLAKGNDRAAEHRVLGVELIQRSSVRNLNNLST